jgi:uncharacterized RDD family membrane protein YckC
MYMYCPECEEKNEDSETTCKNCGYELRSHPSAQPRLLTYAGFWSRLMACIIDAIILSVVDFTIVVFVAVGTTDMDFSYYELYLNSIDWYNLLFSTTDWSAILYSAISIILALFYYAIMESSPSQATFGKQVIGIIVTNQEGKRISFKRAFMRHICKVITGSLFYIGYLTIIFSEKKQGLYDMIVGTVVVYNQ